MYSLTRDGAVIETFLTANAALERLHNVQGQSWEWAHKHEGWDIVDENGKSIFGCNHAKK